MIKILPQIALGLFGILPGNYSGITHVHDNVYAVVDDKDGVDGFRLLTLDIDSVSGKVKNASMEEPQGKVQRRTDGTGVYRDCEGVAYFDEANTIFVSGEDDQRIAEYSLDGKPTGRELAVPSIMGKDKIAHNLGFEALTYNNIQKRFWTTTESTLLADGKHATEKHLDVNNHLRIVTFDISLQPRESYVYVMDKPQGKSSKANDVIGVPSLIALDDGRLIVMEREGCFPRKQYGSWVKIKLYVVDPRESQQVSLDTPMDSVSEEQVLKKTLLCSFTTHMRLFQFNLSNYEGMCIGPKLADGRQTIILIADSQGGLKKGPISIKDHIRLIVVDNL